MESAGAFVGRTRELAALSAGLEDAFAGRGRLFVIGGQPGIGKSRLAAELTIQARARGARGLWGRCWEAGGAPAYWPWVQSLRGYVRDCDPQDLRALIGGGAPYLVQLLPELSEEFPDIPALPVLDPETLRFYLFDAAGTFLKRAAKVQPLVLVLDDLHVADLPSLLLLRFLAAELNDTRILAIGTYRDVELRRAHPLTAALVDLAREPATHSLLLGGLSEPEVGRIIEAATNTTPPERLVATVYKETEGNPLFVGEVVRLLAHEGRLAESGDPTTWRLTIPQGVQQVIGRRLGHLAEPCIRVLSLASVLGREFDPEVLKRVSGMSGEQILSALDEAAADRVISEVPGSLGLFRFDHVLIRDVLYDDLPSTMRVRLHRQIGEVLEVQYIADLDPHLSELAHHFIAATSAGEVEKGIQYARAAGDRAVRLLAYEEAVRLYRMALGALASENLPDEVTRCDLLLALGDAQARAGDFSVAKETFLEAANFARARHMPEQLARAALGYGGRFVWEAGRGDRHLVPLLQDALRALGEENSVLRARVMARLAGGPMRDDVNRRPRGALSLQAVEMARRLGDPATLAYTLDGRYAAVWWPGSLAERLQIATELVEVAERAGDRERAFQGYHYRCLARLEQGDILGVYADLETQDGLANELHQPAQEWYVATLRSTLATFQGRYAEAEEWVQRAFALGRKAQGSMVAGYYALQLYALRKEQGRLAEVEEPLARVARDFPSYPALTCALAHVHAELGRDVLARELFERLAADDFASLPINDEWIFSLCVLAEVATALQDAHRADVLYRLLLHYEAQVALSTPDVCLGSVSRSLGILAATIDRGDDAVRHFGNALRVNTRIGAWPWVAHTQHVYARSLLARNRPDDLDAAMGLLRTAFQTCRDLGMVALGTRVSELLGELEAAHVPTASAVRVSTAPEAVGDTGAHEAAAPPGPNVFRREGEYWFIVFEGDAFRLRDAKGLRYIARLLKQPGSEIHAMDLVATEERRREMPVARLRDEDIEELGLQSSGLEDLGPTLDEEAKATYRRRLAELEEELEEAKAWNDSERAARAKEEMDFLVEELAGAMGLRGRDRRAGSTAERARVNVTRAIKAALVRIREHSPVLGRHLGHTIRTGIFCSYTPDPRVPIIWDI